MQIILRNNIWRNWYFYVLHISLILKPNIVLPASVIPWSAVKTNAVCESPKCDSTNRTTFSIPLSTARRLSSKSLKIESDKKSLKRQNDHKLKTNYFEFGLWICPAVSRPSKCRKITVRSPSNWLDFDLSDKNRSKLSKTHRSKLIVLALPEKSSSEVLYDSVWMWWSMSAFVKIESTSGDPHENVT